MGHGFVKANWQTIQEALEGQEWWRKGEIMLHCGAKQGTYSMSA